MVFTGTTTFYDDGSHTFSLPKGKYKVTLTVSNPIYKFKCGMDGPGFLFLAEVDGPGTYTEEIELYSDTENGDISIAGAGDYTMKIEPI